VMAERCEAQAREQFRKRHAGRRRRLLRRAGKRDARRGHGKNSRERMF
jgi:hypothetical protein